LANTLAKEIFVANITTAITIASGIMLPIKTKDGAVGTRSLAWSKKIEQQSDEFTTLNLIISNLPWIT